MTGQARGSFPFKGSNWFRRPETLTDKAWRTDVTLLDDMHRSLMGAVSDLPLSELHKTPAGSKVSNFALLSGLAAHDLYHAGQIQLLKRLSPAVLHEPHRGRRWIPDHSKALNWRVGSALLPIP